MIEKMKSVCVVARSSEKDCMLTVLRDMGVLHVAEKKTADPAVTERLSTLSKLLLELKDYAPEDGATEEKLTEEQFEEIYRSSLSALEKRAALSSKRTEIAIDLDRLKPWGDFDAEAVKNLPKNLDLHFYRLDKKAYKILAEDENVKFIRLASVEQMETVAVIGKLDSSVSAMEFVIPAKGPTELKAELAECEKDLAVCERTLKEAAKHLRSYREALLKTENDVEYSSIGETLEKDESLIWLSGYIPESEEASFTAAAKEHGWAWMINDVAEDDEAVPTKVRYNKLTALIKPVFDILGVVPGYKEYDISFWFLAFFALFFAMIIGDAGYGALFLVGTLIFNLKTKKITNVILLLYLLSGSTVIWGALTGTWFGFKEAMDIPFLKMLVIPQIANYPEYFGVDSTSVQNNVMKFCFSIGVIQLALACIMSIKRKVSEKNLNWLADLGWLLAISALYFLVLNLVIGEAVNIAVVAIVVAVGFLMVVLFGGMEPGKSFGAGLKAGLGGAFTAFLNTISAFGNVMSYIRLFAVGMASLAIAQSFNDMAAGFDGPLVIVGIVIMAIGHLLNIVMGFLSVVVHGVRLNLLEFSGQLGMEWSGTAYEPFKKINNKK